MANSSQPLFTSSPYIRRISRLSVEQLNNIDSYLHSLLKQDSRQLRKTHYFHDRYENIYVDNSKHPDLTQLIDESRYLGAELTGIDAEALSIGFWFNLMGPGHITDWHTHDDLDELISGVMYLTVPQNSGNLILKVEGREIELEPKAGHYIFFDPETPHAVSENKSGHDRLSIGINMGLSSSQWKPHR